MATDLLVGAPPNGDEGSIVIFPHAGAGPAQYATWPRWVGSDRRVLIVRLPGRETTTEPDGGADGDLHDLAELLATAVADALYGHRFVMLGHSMGAVLAYEVARRLSGAAAPRELIVSGSRAPHESALRQPLHKLATADLVATLVPLGAATAEVAHDPLFQGYWVPIIRRDLRLCFNYDVQVAEPLSLPITALRGTSDPRVNADQVKAWAAYTTTRFTTEEYVGDHFYILTKPAALRRLLRRVSE